MRSKEIFTKQLLSTAVLMIVLCCCGAFGQGWPEVFEPNQLLTLNLQMDPGNWDTIYNDETFDIEVPALFWTDDEEPVLVSVRRKSGDPLEPAWGGGDNKISLKIDINEYYGDDPGAVSEWHGIKKLSLENGDDNNVLTEGITANIHQMASGSEGYGYDAWRANWVKLYVNGHYFGVYVNAEHLDKRFLQNRGLYTWHQTWLYQYRGEYNFTLEIGDDLNPRSPTVAEICYRPFRNEKAPSLMPDVFCDTPNSVDIVDHLDGLVNMQSLLTLAAVDGFTANPDGLFSHQRNAHFLDFDTTDPHISRRRLYFPWDVDSAFQRTDFDIYFGDRNTVFKQVIIDNTEFRQRYDLIICDLLAGPLSEEKLISFVDEIQPVLREAIAEDPYNKITSEPNSLAAVDSKFDDIRNWLSTRIYEVRHQVSCDCDNANLDGQDYVNLIDYAIMADDWCDGGDTLAGDANGDGFVNYEDHRLIVLYWLIDCP